MDQEYVGIDLHKRRCVMVRVSPLGKRLETRRFVSTPTAMAQAVARAGTAPRVVMEATSNWYWAADVLTDGGAELHLAHPLGLNWGHRKVKNDERDAADLADMLRLGRLPEAWIRPAGGEGPARGGPLQGEAGPAPRWSQVPDSRGAVQERPLRRQGPSCGDRTETSCWRRWAWTAPTVCGSSRYCA